jgi:hypothetical protein
MTGRRGFLRTLLAAPIAAKAVASSAGAEMSNVLEEVAMPQPVSGLGPNSASDGVGVAVRRLITHHRRRISAVQDARNRSMSNYPPHIRGMKSWSDSFKQSVLVEEQLNTVEWWDMSYEEQLQELIRRGTISIMDVENAK